MLLVNRDWAFLSHRLAIALEAKAQGYEVHLAVGITDKLDELLSYGFIVHPLTIERDDVGLFKELKTFLQILAVFKKVRPDLVHLVTIKPVLYGGIAARMAGLPAVVAAVPGLGISFISSGLRAYLRYQAIANLYRIAFNKKNMKVIFQNPDDAECLKTMTRLEPNKIALIRGSGVNLEHYIHTPLPEGIPVVVMAARLLANKGVREFVEAARLLKQRGVVARFCLVGAPDAAVSTSILDSELEAWEKEKVVEVIGYRSDIASVFSEAHSVVLPSYREGLPKVLIEAAACGRAVITTDVPGCRDAIEPGVSGLLVPPREVEALADAMRLLIEDRSKCEAMGAAGRLLAEREFDIKRVVASHLDIYKELLARLE